LERYPEDDDAFVCKFGKTNNLSRRCGEHFRTYGDMDDETEFSLELFSNVEPSLMSDAEGKLRTYFIFANKLIKDDTFRELVVLDKTELKMARVIYTDISKLCR
jgi:hypothetical protein